MSDSVLFDELIGDFYSQIGRNFKDMLKLGQIVYTHFFYNYENLEVWRPDDLDDSKTVANSFKVVPSPSDVFHRQIPLSSPRLEINEEFLVVKAKRRPAIVVTLPTPEISIKDVRRGGKINQKVALVVPLFSLEDKNGKAKYPVEFVNRVRRLSYPHLFFFPKNEAFLIKDSLCRLDRLSSTYSVHLHKEDLILIGGAADVFFSQFMCYVTDTFVGDYKTAYELINK